MRFTAINRPHDILVLVHPDLDAAWVKFSGTNNLAIAPEPNLAQLGVIPQLFFAYSVLPKDNRTRELLVQFMLHNDPNP